MESVKRKRSELNDLMNGEVDEEGKKVSGKSSKKSSSKNKKGKKKGGKNSD